MAILMDGVRCEALRQYARCERICRFCADSRSKKSKHKHQPLDGSFMYSSLLKLRDLHDDLRAIADEDSARKALIRLAVLKALQLDHKRFKMSPEGFENRIDELNSKKHEYEVSLSKLRQQYITKERIQELKIEQLHDEVTRLKLQLKGKTNVSERPPPPRKQTGIFSASPYLSRALSQKRETKNYLSPTINSLNKSLLADTTVLSPIPARKKKPKREYTTFKTFGKKLATDSTYGSESTDNTVQSVKNQKQKPAKKDDKANENEDKESQDVLGDLPQPTQSTPEGPSQKMTTRSAARGGSPTKTPSRLSFVENFDRSDDDSSSPERRSPSGTPNRTPGSLFDHPQSFEEVLNQHSFSQSMGTSTPGPNISAESMNILASTPTAKPKRKLSLRKALLSKVTLAPNKSQINLDADQVVDYRDEQFADTSFGSPKAKSSERQPVAPSEPPRKKRNVFKID